jgi:serine/threonine protein kinase/tetratricopeptide (TPR) repeat protein
MSVEFKKDNIISHYKILEKIGAGGMGVVYKAQDTKLDRLVALKFLPKQFSINEEEKKRFIHEAKAAAALDHPNICSVYEIDETDDGQMFMAMGYYEGQTIKDKIERRGEVTSPLPLNEAINIAIQIAQGLERAHESKIIHRDIKSANTIVTRRDEVKILDFGLAKLKGKTKLTKEGTTLGTVDYMSPEQAAGEAVDHRSDIWSLGVVLYEMVTGQVPFRGEYEQAIMYAIMNEDPEPVTGLRSGIPMELERIINKTLAKDPAERYQGAADLIVDLKKVEKDSKPEVTVSKRTTKPETVIKVPRNLMVTGSFILVILIVIAGYFILKKKPQPELPPITSDAKPSLSVMFFENISGDERVEPWREMLAELIITDLHQSKYITVLTSNRLYGILKDMGLIGARRYTSEDINKVALKAGVNYVVLGKIASAGNKFRIDAVLQKAGTGSVIKAMRVEADGEEDIFPKVDDLTRKIKLNFNLSEEQIASDLDKAIGQITTSSPQALRYYIQGRRYIDSGEWRKSINSMEKAIKIDPQFAMAYRSMGEAYGNLGYSAVQMGYRKKAMEFSHRLSDRERYIVEGTYYRNSEKTYGKAIEAFNNLTKLYPQDLLMANVHLGMIYLYLEEWDKSLSKIEVLTNKKQESFHPYGIKSTIYQAKGWYEKAVASLEYYLSNFQDHYLIQVHIAANYCITRKFDIALIEIEKAISLEPQNYQSHRVKGDIYLYGENFISAEQVYQKLIESEEESSQIAGLESIGYACITQGRIGEAAKQFKRILKIAKENNLKKIQTHLYNQMSYIYFRRGKFEECLKEIKKGLAIETEGVGLYLMAITLLKNQSMAQFQKAEKKLMAWINDGRNKKLVRWYYLFQGQKELKKKDFPKAIEHFKKSLSLVAQQSVHPYSFKSLSFHALFLNPLAQAYLESGDLENAQKVFEKMTNLTTGRYYHGDIYARAFYNLGKIYQQKGWKGKAIESYNKFIELWKDCDPIFQPLVRDAKERLAECRGRF